jgi:outer membrane protein assembly factor BamB
MARRSGGLRQRVRSTSCCERTGCWSATAGDTGKETLITVPIVADGTVHIGGTEGGLYGLNPVNGEKLWTASVDAYPYHLVIASGILYVSTPNGLYALKDGELLT